MSECASDLQVTNLKIAAVPKGAAVKHNELIL